MGLTAGDAGLLYGLLLRAIREHEAVIGRLDEFGQRYMVDFPASTAASSVVLRSAWIIRPDEDFPRLTTCFVLLG